MNDSKDFGKEAQTGHSSGVPASWNESNIQRAMYPGTSTDPGAAFNPVKGAGEENIGNGGRTTWNISADSRGINGAQQVSGMGTTGNVKTDGSMSRLMQDYPDGQPPINFKGDGGVFNS